MDTNKSENREESVDNINSNNDVDSPGDNETVNHENVEEVKSTADNGGDTVSTKTVDPSADVEDGYIGEKLKKLDGEKEKEEEEEEDEEVEGIDEAEKERLLKKIEEAGGQFDNHEDVDVDIEAVIQTGMKRALSQSYHAPDGGWGCVIVACALFISLIVDGLTYTFGVFLGEFEAAFKQPKSTIALASSLQVGIYLMIGPVVSALTNRFGCRPIIIAGSFLAGVAFVISSFSPNVLTLILTYGVIGGIGFGMMYLPAIVSVSVYFEKKRAVATGIAVCGSGIGTFILAPLTEKLLEEYNWRSTLLILGGLILNGMVFGALVRPLEMKPIAASTIWSEDDKKKLEETEMDEKNVQRDRRNTLEADNMSRTSALSKKSDRHFFSPRKSKVSICSTTNIASIPLITITDEMDKTTVILGEKKTIPKTETSDAVVAFDDTDETPLFCSVPNMSLVSSTQIKKAMATKIEKESKQKSSSKYSLNSLEDLSHVRKRAHTFGDGTKVLQSAPDHSSHLLHSGRPQAPLGLSFISLSDAHLNHVKEDTHLPLSRRNVHLSGTLANTEWDYKVSHKVGSPGLYVQSIRSIASYGSLGEENKGGFLSCLPGSARDTLGEMLDFHILRNKQYWFVLLGNFFCMIGFYVPFVYVNQRALQLGIDEEKAAFLISIIGITNTVGRVLTGVIIHFLNIDSILVTGFALFFSGAVTMAVPLSESYASLAIMSAVFGLCVAAYISLCSVLLCELLGVANLTNAFGYVILFRGVACVIGPPLAGAIIDSTGVFDQAFYVGGGMIVLGALCHLALYILYLPCVRKRTKHML